MKAKDLIKLLEQHPDEEVAFATRMSFPCNVMPITGVALDFFGVLLIAENV